MNFFLKLLIFLIFSSTNAFSAQDEPVRFTAKNWVEGIHFLGGAVVEVNDYFSKDGKNKLAPGAGAETYVGYYFKNSFALELNSIFSFNPFKGFLLWDTFFAIDFKMRLPELNLLQDACPYAKLYSGWGPAMAYFSDSSKPTLGNQQADRAFMTGPAFGMGLGFFKTTAENLTWFLEVNTGVHFLQSMELSNSTTSFASSFPHETVTKGSVLWSISGAIGILLF